VCPIAAVILSKAQWLAVTRTEFVDFKKAA
jgi:hypothetical protein